MAKTPGPDPPTFVDRHYCCKSGTTGIWGGKHAKHLLMTHYA